jgi:O-antigen/teichoic acid export membrane protein
MSNKIDLSWNSLDVLTHLAINFVAYFLFLTILGAEGYANFIFISLICGVGQSLAKLGQNDYLVVTKELSENTISGIFTLNFLFAIFITTLLIMVFYLISFLSNRDSVFIISAIFMSFSVFIMVISNTYIAFLQKKQMFKKLFLLNFCASTFSIFITYIASNFVKEIFYPVIFTVGSTLTLLILLSATSFFKPRISKINLLNFMSDAKTFIIPLAYTRPIMVVSKNIDSFMVVLIGGDILLVAYNTLKKILVYPFTILYGILDRWLYPLMAKLDNLSEVSKIYNQFIRRIIFTSIIASGIIIYAISLFDNQITYYFASVGIDDIDVILLCYGFVLAWSLFALPSMAYPYAKVMKKTLLLPNLAIFQAFSVLFSFIFIGLLGNHNFVSFGFLFAYLLMNIYIFRVFKL